MRAPAFAIADVALVGCLDRVQLSASRRHKKLARASDLLREYQHMRGDNLVSLSGSVAVVTGGSRGIGQAIVNRLCLLGATVVFTGRDEALLRQVENDLNAAAFRAEGMPCDVTNIASVEALAEHLRKTHGRVDILVNNAGVSGPSGLLHELAPDDWQRIFDTNLRGVYYMMRAVVPLMINTGGGHIINISSLAGKNPLPNGAAYSASKWAVNGLTYGVAEELRSYNIRVSLICPGSVDTGFSPRRGGKVMEKMLKPEDIAHVVESLVTQRPQSFMSEVLLRPTMKP
jgi:NAD(P)-dependent dehydrogenase (short-subunit alcohol dehydrogenase family)